MMRALTGIFALVIPLLAGACSGGGGPLPTTPMTQEQFAEVKANCNLKDAKLVSSQRTEKSTVNGVPMTVTYTDDTPAGVTIKLNTVPSDNDGANMILCLNKEFRRLDAIARIGMEVL